MGDKVIVVLSPEGMKLYCEEHGDFVPEEYLLDSQTAKVKPVCLECMTDQPKAAVHESKVKPFPLGPRSMTTILPASSVGANRHVHQGGDPSSNRRIELVESYYRTRGFHLVAPGKYKCKSCHSVYDSYTAYEGHDCPIRPALRQQVQQIIQPKNNTNATCDALEGQNACWKVVLVWPCSKCGSSFCASHMANIREMQSLCHDCFAELASADTSGMGYVH